MYKRQELSKSTLEDLDEMLLANYAGPESDGVDEEDRVSRGLGG